MRSVNDLNDQKSIPAHADIIIVGGGPIGLLNAWGFKKLNPNLNVVVLEKYEEYQRKHTLEMQPARLKEIINIIDKDNIELNALLKQIQKDKHIRTNELESKLKKLALDIGVNIVIGEVNEKNIRQKLFPNHKAPLLIIGADGTHSTVSKNLFPADNQVKYEFDYVLQLRYEIEGNYHVKAVPPLILFQEMARQGFIANEYVGRFDNGKTPVTMQMMISKKNFQLLKEIATSKEPIKPFLIGGYDKVLLLNREPTEKDFKNPDTIILRKVKNKHLVTAYWSIHGKIHSFSIQQSKAKDILALLPAINETAEDINLLTKIVKKFHCGKPNGLPAPLSKFIYRYLAYQVKNCTEHGLIINEKDVRMSVNEAPATHAKKVTHFQSNAQLLLMGDAALGLSYFKGLNAGIEATAKLFKFIKPTVKRGLKKDPKKFNKKLLAYQKWFLEEFAPRKVKEVERYSTWRIRALMRLITSLSFIKATSVIPQEYDRKHLLAEHFRHQAKNKNESEIIPVWDPYPHRPYDPEIQLGQLSPIPVEYTKKKIAKLFTDYVKPYKSTFHFIKDLQQPLSGIVNLFIGFLKLSYGLSFSDALIRDDGFLSTLRGALEIISTPALILKCPIRGLLTLKNGPPLIENNAGIQKLLLQGSMFLLENLDSDTERRVKHICLDLNRKFEKATARGQATHIPKLKEIEKFNKILDEPNKKQFKNYFTLFANKKEPVLYHLKHAEDEVFYHRIISP